MANGNGFSYQDWQDYLKLDKDMKSKWTSLTALSENMRQRIMESFEGKTKNELLEQARKGVSKDIFELLVSSKNKLDFSWDIQTIRRDRGYGEREEYYIYCLDKVSNVVFDRIKTLRWVANMHWESINKYLQPVSDKIYALKSALSVSINPEIRKKIISYEAEKTKIKAIDEEREIREEIEEAKRKQDIEDAGRNYGPNGVNIVNGEWNVIPNVDLLNQKQFNDDNPNT